ncbi:Protein eva, partial [Operophtera brumata]
MTLPALLLDTLKPVVRAVCDDEVVSLSCPAGTAISILVAQYGGEPPKEHGCAAAADQMCKLPNKMQ